MNNGGIWDFRIWNEDGTTSIYADTPCDLIEMWEDKQPLVNMGELPAPIKKAEIGGHYYFLGFKQNNTSNAIVESISYCPIVDFHCYLLNSGQLFKTKEDCQAWLNAMKGARR